MRMLRCASTAVALLIITACAPERDVLAPSAPSLAMQPQSAAPVESSGHFDAFVDFSTISLTPKGANCLLEVSGRLVFTGTIVGTATGRTSALEFATCDKVAASPPGTYPDRFKSDAVFEGTVGGQPAKAHVYYMGRVQEGGHIDGRFVFSNGIDGVLDVSAIVAVGGEYTGSVVVAPR
jgi:hypothetical protein